MDSKKILIKFGERVREIRKENNLSQEELSYRANLHRTYIGMIERAEKNITLMGTSKNRFLARLIIKQRYLMVF
jgi:transcriptional regulator with XRE-family HTH domain